VCRKPSGQRLPTDSGNIPYVCFGGGQQIVLRKVEVLYVEATEEEGKPRKLVEILSEGVYAYLKHKALVRKESPLRGEEN